MQGKGTRQKSRRARHTGSLFVKVDGAGRESWYGKWRTGGRQVKRRIGLKRPHGTREGLTEGQANARLREMMSGDVTARVAAERRRTIAEIADLHIQRLKDNRALKHSSERSYRHIVAGHLVPMFREKPVDAIDAADLQRLDARLIDRGRSAQTRRNVLGFTLAVLKTAKAIGARSTDPPEVELPRVQRLGEIRVFSPEEVRALVRAAADEQDAAIYLTAAFTGLRRGELLALRWRDVDFQLSTIRVAGAYVAGVRGLPKSGRVRSVPMAPEVAATLARLGQRERWTGDDNLVFPSELGDYIRISALQWRYTQALRRGGLRSLPFHDLRHTFGTQLIAKVDIRRVQEWMGHADISTTMRYLHYAPRDDDARLVASAFAPESPVNEKTTTASA